MAGRECFELRRKSDGLVYLFKRNVDASGNAAYQRQDQDLWITFRPGLGWVAWDHDTASCTGRPWTVAAQDQADFPPEGIWVSRKGDKSYVYELVYVKTTRSKCRRPEMRAFTAGE